MPAFCEQGDLAAAFAGNLQRVALPQEVVRPFGAQTDAPAGGASEWYIYTAAVGGTLHLDTIGSTFNTVLGVYTNSNPGAPSFSTLAAVPNGAGFTTNYQAQGQPGINLSNVVAGTVFYIVVDGYNGATGTARLNIGLGVPPNILTQPQSRPTTPGGAASFSVAVVGTTNFYYQWQFDGGNIARATNSTYSLTNAQNTAVGSYVVVVSNAINVVTSAPAVLTLRSSAFIISGPANEAVPQGKSAAFSVNAGGVGALSYQWYFDGNKIAKATATNFTIAAAQYANAGAYMVVVSNSLGAASNGAVLSVTESTLPKVAIASPSRNYSTNNPALLVRGTASDNQAVTAIGLFLNSNAVPNVIGATNNWTNWSANVTLAVGTNYITAYGTNPANLASAPVTRTITYIVTSPLTLLTNPVGAGSIKASFQGTNLDVGQKYTVTAVAGAGEAFGNWTGSTAPATNNPLTFPMASNMVLRANFIPAPPTITSPAAGARTNNPIVKGTTSGNRNVTNVLLWITNLNTGTTLAANALLTTTNWSLNISNLASPGTNIVAAQSIGPFNTASPIASRAFFVIQTALFTLSTNGNGAGTITGSASLAGDAPPTNRALLNIGEGYTLAATPDSHSWFTNWTSSTGFTSNSPTLHFLMTNGLAITAHFATNLFFGVPGPYNGLFYEETNPVTEQTAGMFSGLTIKAPSGSYSATLWLNGASYGLSGSFNVSGYASNYLTRSAKAGGPVTVQMTNQWTGGVLNGQVSGTNGGLWTAALYAETASTSSNSAEYTVLFPPSTNVEGAIPPGYGYVLMTNYRGNLVLSYSLADGTAFSKSVPVGQFQDVPLYGSLYTNGGLLLGWINLTNGAETPVTWLKPFTKTGLFTNGFTNLLSVEGSAWTNHTTSLTNGTLLISNATLNSTYVVSIVSNAIVNEPGSPSTNSLTGTVNPKTGLLQVTFGTGIGKATLTGACAILQNTTNGGGYFVTQTNAGFILLQP